MPWWVGRWQLSAVAAGAATTALVIPTPAGADTGLPWWLWLIIALSSGTSAVTGFRDARRHRYRRRGPHDDST